MGRALYFPLLSDAAILFRDSMQSVIGKIDFVPEGDGQIHRFHVPGDKPGTLNGVYCLHVDAIASGWYGTWKDGGHWHTWSARKPADSLQAELIRKRNEQAKRQHEVERRQRNQAAAEYVNRLWCDARRADPGHPYLIAKGCRPYNLRQKGNVLLVPLTLNGQLVNVQRIHPDGSKRFLSGGRVKGCYSPLGIITADQPLSLFALTVAESGDRKSAADRLALQAHQQHQRELLEQYKVDAKEYRDQRDAYQKARANILDKAKGDPESVANDLGKLLEPEAPPLPFILSEEPTLEGL